MTDSANRTTLITGGAGFIGSHLADALLQRGERVISLDNFDSYYSPARKRRNIAACLADPRFTLVEGDIRDRALLERLVDVHRPQRIAHLAALAGVRHSIEHAPLFVDVNVQGTVNVLDAARHGAVEHVVFASTSSIYGRAEVVPFSEDLPTDRPLAPYPATKKAAEVMGHAYHNMFGLGFTALRFFTVYGPRVRPDMMAYTVMERIVRGQPITLFDGGLNLHRDWTYIDDIIQGVVAALDAPPGCEVFNLGRGKPVRLLDFVTTIEELTGRKALIEAQPTPSSEPPITYASIEKARRMLGYQPRTSIREGLAATWAWYCSEAAVEP
jgi:UDP-glucuronate 4-epimerase